MVSAQSETDGEIRSGDSCWELHDTGDADYEEEGRMRSKEVYTLFKKRTQTGAYLKVYKHE